jgi:hypothetical protein
MKRILVSVAIATLVSSSLVATALAQSLPTWSGSFTYQGMEYNYTMVGANPATLNSSTTVQAFLIPLKIVFTACTTPPCTFDARPVIQTVTLSPIFASAQYIQGGTNLGTTQYIDAFQRGNFWGAVQSNPNYHLLLGGPTAITEQTINVPSNEGCVGTVNYGYPVGQVDYHWLDGQIRSLINSLGQIAPDTLPIFLTYDVVANVVGGGTCGRLAAGTQGYHGAITTTLNPQTYVQFGYLDPGQGVQPDVSILSHEVGEWADDPLLNNYPTPCGTNLEVGDPLIGHNYQKTVNNITYNLQDLVFLPYFGAPRDTSVNQWFSFQNEPTQVCTP